MRALLRSPRRMLSSALKSMMAKRGASSLAGKGIEFSGDKDVEESSKPRIVDVEANGSLELLGEVSGTRVEFVATRTSDRKRARRLEEEVGQPLEKKGRGLIKLRANEAGRPGSSSKEPEEPLAGEVFSAAKAAASAKELLDQVWYPSYFVFFSSLLCVFVVVLVSCCPCFCPCTSLLLSSIGWWPWGFVEVWRLS